MFLLASINWWAVIVCMVVSVVVGSVWFGPKTFFPIWWQALGRGDAKPGDGHPMAVVFGLTFVASFVQPLVMSLLLHALYPSGTTWQTGAQLGLLLWGGIRGTTCLSNRLFAGYPWIVYLLEVGNHLINFVLFGIILALWW
jgi:hypothetical protein